MFTGVTGDVCSKSALMGEARRGAVEREGTAQGKAAVMSYDKEDIRIVTRGDTAVTSYRFVVRVQMDGADIQRRCRTTNVWGPARGSMAGRCRSHSGSEVARAARVTPG